MPITWIQNYIQCKYSKNQMSDKVAFDELIGPWYTMLKSTVLFAICGAIFGTAHCFRYI